MQTQKKERYAVYYSEHGSDVQTEKKEGYAVYYSLHGDHC